MDENVGRALLGRKTYRVVAVSAGDDDPPRLVVEEIPQVVTGERNRLGRNPVAAPTVEGSACFVAIRSFGRGP